MDKKIISKTTYLDDLLASNKMIKSALTNRHKKTIEKTVSAKTSDGLEKKIELELAEGWRVPARRSSKGKSMRLEKEKLLDEQLEDELWCITARMGFDELSDGRKFTVYVGEGLERRQIDVFAKDHDTAILIECTQVETPKRKSLAHLIEKIESIKSTVSKSINAHYGTEPKLKIRWVIATKNIEWGDADLKKAEAAKIIVLRDQEIEYYTKLSESYKQAAKYQFLAHLFADEEIGGLKDVKVPATKGKMGGVTFYSIIMKPSDLLKISYVSHKISRNADALSTYQRMLEPKRLKSIANYIDNKGQFPTNIVVNIKTSRELLFEQRDKIGELAVGSLTLPHRYATAWIIDGQHRLYGYSLSKRAQIDDDKTTFPVLAYCNLPDSQEARLFVDINNEQVRVKKDLLIELYSNLKWDSSDPKERGQALRSRIILILGQNKTSPICNRLKRTGSKKTSQRCLTVTNFNDGLEENGLLGETSAGVFRPGPLWYSPKAEPKDTVDKAVDFLSGYFKFFADALPSHWDAGDAPQGYFCTNLGLRALLRLLKEIVRHISSSTSVELDRYDADFMLEKVKPYTVPLTDFFKKATIENLKSFKISSKEGVKKSSLTLMKLIHDKDPSFCPSEMKTWLENLDEEGTKDAKDKLGEIIRKLNTVTMALLKRKHGEGGDKWWYEGVPENIRADCSKRREEDKGGKNKEQYLYLKDYHAIAAHDWELFQKYYSCSKDGGKAKQLQWVLDLNKIRQTTHHEEKWPATKQQVACVRECYEKVMSRFVLD